MQRCIQGIKGPCFRASDFRPSFSLAPRRADALSSQRKPNDDPSGMESITRPERKRNMNTIIARPNLHRLTLVLVLLSTLNSQLSTVLAQGTAFTYQGRLNNGANPATGSYDM